MTRRNRSHWRRHGVVRPSAAGIAALVCDAAFWFMGLLLDDRALMAAALAVTMIWGVSLLLAVAQWLLVGRLDRAVIDGLPGGRAVALRRVPRRPAWRRLMLPRTVAVRRQYERLDQDGHVTGRHIGVLPASRGLYRCAAVFLRWHDPFGLFSASRLMPSGGETVVLPPADDAFDARRRAVDQRLQGHSQSADTGGVREYAPGDPPKLVAWKATAHRGELMTRETGRDIRSSLIVVLDVRSSQADGARMTDALVDAQVAQVLPLLQSLSSDRRLIVTDGVRFADDPERCARLLAAMSPISAASRGANGADGASHAMPDDGADDAPDNLAARVAMAAMRQTGVVTVRLLTADPQGPLADALRQAVGGDRVRVTAVSAAEPDGDEAAVTTVAQLASSRRQSVLSRTFTAIALLVYFGLSIAATTGLIAGTGYWPWFAAAVFAVISIEANLPVRSRRRYVVRTVAVIVLVAGVAAAIATIRIHDVTRIWPFDLAAIRRINAAAAADAASASSAAVSPLFGGATDPTTASSAAATPFSLIGDTVTLGFDALDSQLPPLVVPPAGDLVLVLFVAAIAVICRLILISRRVAPVFAALPVALFAADYALVGHSSDWWRIALLAAVFLLNLWMVRPERSLAHVPVAVTAVVTAASLALTPAAIDFAYTVPLSFGNSAGLLSANTINPMVDLKRSLASGSDTIVLTYDAYQRTYLRMTTLDEFNGDTWSFDEALSDDANLYGSGIQLGLDSSNIMPEDQRRIVQDPLSMYLYLYGIGLDGDSYNAGTGGSVLINPANGAYASRFNTVANVTIETLRSRFLPMPGVTGILRNGLGSDWLHAGSTVYNRTSTTAQGQQYLAVGVGLQPISSTSGMNQISVVESIRRTVEESAQRRYHSWSDRAAARRQAADNGRGSIHGDWLIMPVHIDAPTGSVLDTTGNVIGTATWGSAAGGGGSEGGGSEGDWSRGPGTTLSGISLGDDLRNDLLIADYEPVVTLRTDDNGKTAIAILMSGSDDNEADDYRSAEALAGNADLQRKFQTLGTLRAELGYDSMTIGTAGGGASEAASYLLEQVDAMNRYAKRHYRTLPDDLPENVRALVRQAQADGVATDGDGYDHQVAAMRWLVDYFTDPANGFVYSLDSPDGDGRSNLDVISTFLDAKSGYCAHYASALAVLGRAMGVPTRMVLGYNAGAGGTNGDGEFEVRAKQLHAWVDAYIDGVGWVPFDVTPATTENGSAASDDGSASDGDDNTSGNATAAPNSTTTDDTTDANATDPNASDMQDDNADGADGQTDATQSADATATGETRPWWNRLDLPRWAALALWMLGGAAVLVGLALLPAGIRLRRRRGRLRVIDMGGDEAAAGGDDAWLAAWSEICDAAWDAGVRWRPSDTEHAIASRIAGALASPDRSLAVIADQVTAIAFGVSPRSTARETDLRESVDRVLAGLKIVRERLPIHVRVRFLLLPASLFRRSNR